MKNIWQTRKSVKDVYGQIKSQVKYFVQDINVRRGKTMCKYGQAEYAYYILRQTAEKMLEKGVLTKEQFKHLDELNKRDCFSQFCTALEV